MMKKLSILILLISLVLLSVSFANAEETAWRLYNTPEVYEEETSNVIEEYNEAPEFEEMVQNGELESVENRLPEQPMVIGVEEEIGSYGGTWDRIWTGVSDEWGVNKPIGERFLTWDRNIEAHPNIAMDWEIKNDDHTVIFYLRKGMKWSDGEPLTADDFEYWYENVISNEDLNPAFPDEFVGPDGGIAEFTKIDDYTFKYDFTAPMAMAFVMNKPTQCPIHLVAPKHYMKQFHPDFADEEELEAKVEEADFDTWMDLYDDKDHYLMNHERPVLFAWRTVTENPDASQFILERNPYYWKVDTEGNQLPYIDEIRLTLVEDSEVITMRALTGDIDFQSRHVQLDDFPVLKENEEKGGYNVWLSPRASGAFVTLMPNQNIQDDPVKKEIYQNKRFRHAISLAINREEINEMVHLGLGTPRQAAFVSQSPFYSEEWEKAYAEFDTEKAEKILDEIGLDEKDSDGYRLRPDGERLRLTLDYSGEGPTSTLELVKGYLENVGLRTELNMMDRSLFMERSMAANVDIPVWGMDRVLRPDLQTRWWVVNEQMDHHYASLWGLYRATDGAEGEEPPEYFKRLQDIADELEVTADMEKRKELMDEVTDIHKEQIHVIGTVGEQPVPIIINKNLKNVPYDIFMTSELLRDTGYAIPQTFFFDE